MGLPFDTVTTGFWESDLGPTGAHTPTTVAPRQQHQQASKGLPLALAGPLGVGTSHSPCAFRHDVLIRRGGPDDHFELWNAVRELGPRTTADHSPRCPQTGTTLCRGGVHCGLGQSVGIMFPLDPWSCVWHFPGTWRCAWTSRRSCPVRLGRPQDEAGSGSGRE